MRIVRSAPIPVVSSRAVRSPPPCGEGVGGGGPSADHRMTPTPALRADPPHKGEGKMEFSARADSTSHPTRTNPKDAGNGAPSCLGGPCVALHCLGMIWISLARIP